jgi:hypothetical protein
MRIGVWSVLLGSAVCALAAPNSPPAKIGSVVDISGSWCRQGNPVKLNDTVYFTDDIRYCNNNVPNRSHHIMIRFDRKPPYNRPYKCETPGICDHPSKLWLIGAYLYGPGKTPPGTPTISPPRTNALVITNHAVFVKQAAIHEESTPTWHTIATIHSSINPPPTSTLVIPDRILEVGSSIDTTVRSANSSKPDYICNLGLSSNASSVYGWFRTKDGDYSSIRCLPYDTGTIVQPGIYGLFYSSDQHDPAALIGVVSPDSSALHEWDDIPEAFRFDTDPKTVAERRSYLVTLAAPELDRNPPVTRGTAVNASADQSTGYKGSAGSAGGVVGGRQPAASPPPAGTPSATKPAQASKPPRP